ncbi:hypothetical protein [Microbulbifer spongiae]|uniref:Uncharacterized protein n=1 Tax=Microbulbifer spongiae TaxID=2944933 RepID=A0ABY9EB13_9GAMM|nr:hypothetical protein [Microbulbifer sp. MI-G]WKD49660.1 hypothetical protein M8T91_17495 [Microbulbifer sp. MI-G]
MNYKDEDIADERWITISNLCGASHVFNLDNDTAAAIIHGWTRKPPRTLFKLVDETVVMAPKRLLPDTL